MNRQIFNSTIKIQCVQSANGFVIEFYVSRFAFYILRFTFSTRPTFLFYCRLIDGVGTGLLLNTSVHINQLPDYVFIRRRVPRHLFCALTIHPT